jgi:hypothetical protein
MDNSQLVYFEETQRFPAWVGALLVAGAVIAGFGAIAASDGTDRAMPALLAIAAGVALISVIFGALTLTVEVTDAGVRVKGFLFIDRLIRFTDIESAAARRYRPILEYGGWGYRLGPSGKAYNTRGNEGVQLILKNGGRVLIGSGRAQELADLISARLKS